MPVRSPSTRRLFNLRRAIAGAEPGPGANVTGMLIVERPQHITELCLGLPRHPSLK
jgi:hypothetical protein